MCHLDTFLRQALIPAGHHVIGYSQKQSGQTDTQAGRKEGSYLLFSLPFGFTLALTAGPNVVMPLQVSSAHRLAYSDARTHIHAFMRNSI